MRWQVGRGFVLSGESAKKDFSLVAHSERRFFTPEKIFEHSRWVWGIDLVLFCGERHQTQVEPASDEPNPKTFALDGATECNIRADGFGDFTSTRECGPNGLEPSLGIYMRNKMFISSIVSVVGNLVLAGSASAGVMYDFSAVFDTTAVTTNAGNARQRTDGTLTSGLFANFEAEARYKDSQVSGAVGSVSMIAGRSPDKGGIGAFTLDSGGLVDATLLVNLSGTTSFSINVNAYSGTSTVWVLEAVSMSGGLERSMSITKTGVSSAGLLTFNMIDAVYITPTGFDMSRIALVSVVMQREVLGSAGSTTSASFDSFTYAAVPGPGSIALLGAAGLVGARRRRA